MALDLSLESGQSLELYQFIIVPSAGSMKTHELISFELFSRRNEILAFDFKVKFLRSLGRKRVKKFSKMFFSLKKDQTAAQCFGELRAHEFACPENS